MEWCKRNISLLKKVLLVVTVMVVGVVLQYSIFKELNAQFGCAGYYKKTIIYDLIGIIVCICTYFTFTNIRISNVWKYIMIGLFYICVFALKLVMSEGMFSVHRAAYFTSFFYPIFLALFIYLNQRKGLRSIVTGGLLITGSLFFFCFIGLTNTELAGLGLVSVLIMADSCSRKMFGEKNFKKYSVCLNAVAIIFVVFYIINCLLHPYELQKHLLGSIKNCNLVGNFKLEYTYLISAFYSNYIVNVIFSYYGVAIGFALIILLVLFLIKIKDEKNNIISRAAWYQVVVQITITLISNFGIIHSQTNALPFVGFGFINTIVYCVLLGIIF